MTPYVDALQATAPPRAAQRSSGPPAATQAVNIAVPPAPQLFVRPNAGPLLPATSNGATSLQQQVAQLQQALAAKQNGPPGIPRSPVPRGKSAGTSTAMPASLAALATVNSLVRTPPALPASMPATGAGVLPPPPPLRGIDTSPTSTGIRTPLLTPTALTGARPETPNTLTQALMALQASPASGEGSLRGGLGSAGSGGRGNLFSHGLSTPLGLSQSPYSAMMHLGPEFDGQIGGRSMAGEGLSLPPPSPRARQSPDAGYAHICVCS